MRYYLLSDVHSFYGKLLDALTDAGFFAYPGEKRLVILGDLFDRGSEPLELMYFILRRLKEDELILIKGNHEELFVKLCTSDRGIATHQHTVNGTYETALKLTGIGREHAAEHPEELAAAGMQTAYVTKIIPRMADYYETEHYIFCHGWLPSATDADGNYMLLDSWRSAPSMLWEKARWINGMKAAYDGAAVRGKTVICGHRNCSWGHSNIENNGPEFGPGADFSPYRAEGIIAIDACTSASGKMNCLVIDD